MAFEPRLLADGTPCCTSRTADGRLAFPANACPACRAHAASRRRALRAAHDYTPPDPYAAGLAKLKETTR